MGKQQTRAIILVLDSFGLGATDDADKFGDVGADTFGHIAEQRAKSAAGPLKLPNLAKLGLFHAGQESTGKFHPGHDPDVEITGAYGHAAELSSGKDTPSGHWEIAGVPVLFDWGYFSGKENAFPKELLDKLIAQAESARRTRQLSCLGHDDHRRARRPACRERQAYRLYVGGQRVPDCLP